MKAFITLLALLALNSAIVLAGGIQIIPLQNRLSEELIPIIKPMLGPNDAISGQGFQLFLRTSDENMQQIRLMISKLDSAQKLLLISVFQGDVHDLRTLGVAGNISYQNSHNDLGYSTGNTSARLKLLSTTRNHSDNPIHQLRISEGTQGYIETGESIPYFSGGYPDRTGLIYGGVEYKDIHSGFYVLPRVHGDQVTLDINPYKEKRSQEFSGAYETSSASTTITGPLGQWLPIGGVTEQSQNTRSDMTSYIATRSGDDKRIWIKAEVVE